MVLKDRNAIVTGGGRGIGRAIAKDLAKEGCNIVVSSRNEEELKRVEAEAKAYGVKALGLKLDLAEEENIEVLVDRTLAELGSIDILVNNAGIILPKPFLEVTLEEWDRTLSINLRSAFILSQRALKEMKKSRNGYIVNISSTVALGVPPHLAAYGASKAGMVGLSQALYESAREFGVRVSTVYPGITDTKMVRDIDPPTQPGQWMLPEDISYCVMFLLKQSDRMVVKDIVPWSVGYDKI